MSRKTMLSAMCAIFTLLATSSIVSAQSLTYCPKTSSSEVEYDYGSGSTVLVLGVAANFAGPLGTYLTTYFLPNYSGYTVAVCSDSTSNLEAKITSTSNPYAMLFAADTSAQNYSSTAVSIYRYAIGDPVFFGYTSGSGQTYYIRNMTDLLNNSAGVSSPITTSSLSGYTVSPTLTTSPAPSGTSIPQPSVAIANPSKAPYGAMAETILNDMGLSLPGTVPSWLEPLNTYANITTAFSSVGGTTAAGFAAKSQVCSLSNVVYIEFNNTAFQLDQYAASFTTNALNTYIQSQMTSSGNWGGFVTGACYLGY